MAARRGAIVPADGAGAGAAAAPAGRRHRAAVPRRPPACPGAGRRRHLVAAGVLSPLSGERRPRVFLGDLPSAGREASAESGNGSQPEPEPGLKKEVRGGERRRTPPFGCPSALRGARAATPAAAGAAGPALQGWTADSIPSPIETKLINKTGFLSDCCSAPDLTALF